MTKERAYELQGNIAKEAIALLVIHGPSVDVTPYQKVVMLIGSVWGLPAASTQQRLDLISQEENAAAETAYPAETVHAMERKDLPINASGIETMDNIWGLFETAVKLDNLNDRREMYNLARELEECQNLLDWIAKNSEEQKEFQTLTAGTCLT